MSHYAKITAPVEGWLEGLPATLPIGTSLKCVKFENGGAFSCDVLVPATPNHTKALWAHFVTQADLPAFTDKGSARRAAGAGASNALRKGRPRVSSTASTHRLVCKVTEEQAQSVFRSAEARGLTVPRYLRQLLIEDGMPE